MNLYVGNLSWNMTEDDLRNLFEQYGTVTSIKIVKDRETGRSKGFGFVEMENDTEAQNALSSLYDKEILGRKIVINEAQEDQPNQAVAVVLKRGALVAAVAAITKAAAVVDTVTVAAIVVATIREIITTTINLIFRLNV